MELRNAISSYEEASPLYGLLKYRRRNVIIKYQPEDCSRLVQGRCAPKLGHLRSRCGGIGRRAEDKDMWQS